MTITTEKQDTNPPKAIQSLITCGIHEEYWRELSRMGKTDEELENMFKKEIEKAISTYEFRLHHPRADHPSQLPPSPTPTLIDGFVIDIQIKEYY